MSSISSLLHLQMEAEKTPSAQMALHDAEGRVRSMMVLYDKLYNSSNYNSVSISDYLPSLLHEIVSLFQSKISIEIDVVNSSFCIGCNNFRFTARTEN